MTTLGQLVDRTLRDWLEPADDQPIRIQITTGISASGLDTGITFDATLIGPEIIEILGPGTLIEFDSEEMILADANEDAATFDIAKRGVNGTSSATHASGAFGYPHRVWRRRVLFDALCDGVVGLFPELYRTVHSASMAVASTTYTEIPQAVVDDGFVAPKHFLGLVGSSTDYHPYAARLISPAPMVDSGKAIVVNLPSGATGYLVYKAKFLRPDAEADDLTADFGVQADWERIVELDAVSYLIAGREFDHVTQERLSEQLEQQGYPAGTPSQIRDSLLRYREVLVNRAQDALRVDPTNAVTVTTMEPF